MLKLVRGIKRNDSSNSLSHSIDYSPSPELLEEWSVISEFPYYSISNLGRVFNERYNHIMRPSVNNHGHLKITLAREESFFNELTKEVEICTNRYTRSVARLVAEAFVEVPNSLCNEVVVLDGRFQNVVATNLVWRPRWYAWKYTRQLKTKQPIYYRNLRVLNLVTKVEYDSIVEAGMSEGLLFDLIWESTYTQKPLFPYGHIFEVTERV